MATLKRPQRGEVWWVTFDPALGTEISKCRPAIVISNDTANKYLDRVQVVPLTSNITKVYASECLITLTKQTGKAMADQIRTVSTSRLVKKIEKITVTDMALLEQVIRLQLGLG
jgi:mRNA interferase MazF